MLHWSKRISASVVIVEEKNLNYMLLEMWSFPCFAQGEPKTAAPFQCPSQTEQC